MVTDTLFTNLQSLLEKISYGLLIGCFFLLLSQLKETGKVNNVVVLAFFISLSLTVVSKEDLATRIIFGYVILIVTILVLAFEMIKKSKESGNQPNT